MEKGNKKKKEEILISRKKVIRIIRTMRFGFSMLNARIPFSVIRHLAVR